MDIDETSYTSCRCIRVLHGTQLVITPALDTFVASAAKVEDLYVGAMRKLVDSGLAMLLWKLSAKTRNSPDAQTAGRGIKCRLHQGRRWHEHKIEVMTDLSQRKVQSSWAVVPAEFERLWERRSGSWSRLIGIEGIAHL